MRNVPLALCALLILTCCAGTGNRNCSDDAGASFEGKVVDNDKYVADGRITVSKTSDLEWITRYDDQIQELEAKASADTVSQVDVVFFGSSSIRLWKGLEGMMSPLKVVNRGYGGATVRDIHYNYASVLAHYRPKAFVIFCDNDIAGNEHDLTVGEVFDHYRLLFNRLEENYSGTPVFFLSWKYSGLRASLRDKQKVVNEIMKDYASVSRQVTFVDVNSLLLDESGNVNKALFEPDDLHINHEGYLLWTSVLKPLLEDVCDL